MILNMRDLADLETTDGAVIRRGKLIRSARLDKATDEDVKVLTAIPVTKIIDFRTPKEVREKPDRVIPGIENINIPVLENFSAGISREKESDKVLTEIVLRSLDNPDFSKHYMCCQYDSFMNSEFGRKAYHRFIEELLSNDTGASLWHCTAGKDRAGMGSLIIEGLLGVTREDMVRDYERTNGFLTPMMEERLKFFAASAGITVEEARLSVEYMYTARPEYIHHAFEMMDREWGGMENYLEKGIGIDPQMRREIREKFLER